MTVRQTRSRRQPVTERFKTHGFENWRNRNARGLRFTPYFFYDMTKLDPIITRQLQNWLDTPAEGRDAAEGATLYLRVSRNHALYNSVMRNPRKFMPKLEYELRKLLRIRLDNMTASDIVRLERHVLPKVEETVSETPEIPVDSELPQAEKARGRRMDHDSLPDEIRELWDSNGERHRKIVLLFNELKAMSEASPCDRYEKLVILEDLDRTYRSNLEKYDNYAADAETAPSTTSPVQVTDEETDTPADEAVSASDAAKVIGAARKTISTAKKTLAAMDPEDVKASELREKIAKSVDMVRSLGGTFSRRQIKELGELGVTVAFDNGEEGT